MAALLMKIILMELIMLMQDIGSQKIHSSMGGYQIRISNSDRMIIKGQNG